MMKKNVFVVAMLFSAGCQQAALEDVIEPPTVTIPAGEFMMGGEGARVSPAHKVQVKAFEIGKYEVTVKEFAQFIEATSYQTPSECRHQPNQNWHEPWPVTKGSWENNDFSDSEFHPVVCIGAGPAQAYANWLSEVSGKSYRLLSEAEWEYAARAGKDTQFNFGEDPNLTQICEYENVADLSAEQSAQNRYGATYLGVMVDIMGGISQCDDKSGFASIVGQYKPNSFGVYDMIGNVSEFTQDCYNSNYIGAPVDGSAWLNGNCEKRMVRGSSWHWLGGSTRDRGAPSADWIGALEGFRLALDIPDHVTDRKSNASEQFEKDLLEAQKAVIVTTSE